MRAAVVVAVHIDGSPEKTLQLKRCVSAIRLSGARLLCKGDLEIHVVDDASDVNIGKVLSGFEDIRIVRNEARKGKAYSINRIVEESSVEIIAVTDCDCEVGESWLSNIISVMNSSPGVIGVAGPNWSLSQPASRVGRWLTRNEAKLLESIQRRQVNKSNEAARIDLRNCAVLRKVLLRCKIPDRVQRGLSASLSYRLRQELCNGERIVFSDSLFVEHQGVQSITGIMSVYFMRGYKGEFLGFYREKHKSLLRAFRREYFERHFSAPVLENAVSPIFVILVHGAFWCGILRRALDQV